MQANQSSYYVMNRKNACMPKSARIRPEGRKTFKAYDGLNNTFNLVYSLLKWKVHTAIVKARLEAYLGFLHSEQFGKPSLTCDLIELYRCFADDFLIQNREKIKRQNFMLKKEEYSTHKAVGKREVLNKRETDSLIRDFYAFLERKVDVPRMKVGKTQTIETLINEEALLFAKYLRDERETWTPRRWIAFSRSIRAPARWW